MVIGRRVIVHLHLGATVEQFVYLIIIDRILQVEESAHLRQRQSQGRRLRGARNDVTPVHGVERTQQVNIETHHLGHLFEVDITADHDGVALGRQTRRHGTDIVKRVVGHDIVGGYESRHVTTRLPRQVGVDVPIVRDGSCRFAVSRLGRLGRRCVGTANGFVDVLRTAVVGGNDQIPVTENLVEVAQVAGSGKRREHGIAAFVDQGIELQPVLFAGSRHKLPQAGGPHPTDSLRIESRLNDGQVFQFQRQLIHLEGLLENGYIEVGGAKHIADRTAQTATIAVNELLDDVIIRHLHHARHAVEALYILLATVLRIDILHITVLRLVEVSLGHIEIEQRVEVVGHGLRELDDLLVATLVDHGNLVLLVRLVFIVVNGLGVHSHGQKGQ